MLTTLVFAGLLLASPHTQADKWDLSAGHAPKTTAKFDLAVQVNQGGQDHSAAMKYAIDRKDADKDKPQKAEITWTEILLDGAQSVPDGDWPVTLDAQGAITDTDSSEGADPVKKMLMPLTFVYPTAAVGVGDTWTSTIKGGTDKDDQSITVDMKADSMDKVGDIDALKVTEKLSQKGSDSLSGTGTWWVDKTGKILKFEMKVDNWVVTIAGPDLMNATFTGTAAK